MPWFSSKQHSATLSSAEAEYIAASETVSELTDLKGVARNLNQEETSKLFMDNQRAIHVI